MKSAVIGLGETGRPLFEILQRAYPDIEGIDIRPFVSIKPGKLDIINICIPYSDKFEGIVNDYIDLFNPDLTIIHSTVPIGTTSKFKNAVHSPILGKHDNMYEDIKNFRKWIGGEKADEARDYFQVAGLLCETVATSEETEALKLMCLAKYGMSIAFAQYQQDICNQYRFNFIDVIKWDTDYNENVDWWLKRPLITKPNGKIGGHCILPNTKILNEQHPNPILEEILKYE